MNSAASFLSLLRRLKTRLVISLCRRSAGDWFFLVRISRIDLAHVWNREEKLLHDDLGQKAPSLPSQRSCPTQLLDHLLFFFLFFEGVGSLSHTHTGLVWASWCCCWCSALVFREAEDSDDREEGRKREDVGNDGQREKAKRKKKFWLLFFFFFFSLGTGKAKDKKQKHETRSERRKRREEAFEDTESKRERERRLLSG